MDEESSHKKSRESIKCVLSQENSDFELDISQNGYEVQNIRQSGFEWLWKAAKSNFGVSGGKFMYEVRIKEFIEPEPYHGHMHIEKKKLRMNNYYFITDSLKINILFSNKKCRRRWLYTIKKILYESDFLRIQQV